MSNSTVITLSMLVIAIISFAAGAIYQTHNPGKLFPAAYCNNEQSIPNNPETDFFNISYSLRATEFFNNVVSYDIIEITSNSDSMRPSLHSGSQILILFEVKEEDLQVGMIIGFGQDPTTIHRIIRIEEDDGKNIYITKGDNNPFEDDSKTVYEDIKYVVGAVIY